MPVDVPREPKKLTTIYDNFKGVDYTDDASNSYRRRSPSGKNMLPDLDGVPHKRPGWEVAVKAEDFITALDAPDYSSLSTYNVGDFVKHDGITYACKTKIETPMAWNEDYWKVASVTPNRTHYFSYGGYDYLMIFNSLGVFWMRQWDESPTRATILTEEVNEVTPMPSISNDNSDDNSEPETYTTYTVDTFPPSGSPFPADHNRAFFFEGNGVSGFYVFVANDIYRFCQCADGNMHFVPVPAKIPTVTIAAVPASGAGTDNEPMNLLTDYRTIEYCGEANATEYNLVIAADEESISVSILNANGDGKWVNIPSNHGTYGWAYNNNKVTFNTAPPASTEGNVRITYAPYNSTIYDIEYNKHTNQETTQNSMVRTVSRQRYMILREAGQNDGIPVGKEHWIDEVPSKDLEGHVIIIGGVKFFCDFDSAGSWDSSTKERYTSRSEYLSTYGTATLKTPNIMDRDELVLMSDFQSDGDYTDKTSDFNIAWDAYNGSATVSANSLGIFDTGETFATGITGWITGTGYWTWDTYFDEANVGALKTRYPDLDFGSTPNNATRAVIKFYGNGTQGKTKSVNVYGQYTKYSGDDIHEAFSNCRKSLTFGNNIYNQVFISSCDAPNYRNRVWYSAVNNPAYFPDTNYIEAGADDKAIMGLIKVGSYLGIIKMGSGTEASIYLAYATSFDEESTYAVKQSVSGIGAVSVGAFNILNGEPLFLSSEGVMGIDLSEESEDKQVRNRSFFVNKKLCNEPKIGIAVSFIYKGMYYLAVDGRCYVLDGSQKSSWANEKTNLQYECYYLENIPAQCFAKMGDRLYFNDYKGNLCRFKKLSDPYPYVDTYSVATPKWTYDVVSPPATIEEVSYTDINDTDKTAKAGDIMYVADGRYYTIVTEYDEDGNAEVMPGVPIEAQWDTIADDDGMVHFFKNLTKKGCVVSFMPDSNGVDVYLKADEKEPVYIGTMPTTTVQLPSEGYVRKKIKKYKRLQIICKNDRYNEGFAIDQIIKTYTVGNYSKNRG